MKLSLRKNATDYRSAEGLRNSDSRIQAGAGALTTPTSWLSNPLRNWQNSIFQIQRLP